MRNPIDKTCHVGVVLEFFREMLPLCTEECSVYHVYCIMACTPKTQNIEIHVVLTGPRIGQNRNNLVGVRAGFQFGREYRALHGSPGSHGIGRLVGSQLSVRHTSHCTVSLQLSLRQIEYYFYGSCAVYLQFLSYFVGNNASC